MIIPFPKRRRSRRIYIRKPGETALIIILPVVRIERVLGLIPRAKGWQPDPPRRHRR